MTNGQQLTPKKIEAEEAVLGAILVNPEALYEVIPFLQVEDFFVVRHGWIFEAMLALNARREPIDYLTVLSELEQYDRLAEVGGGAYLLKLINETPSSLNIEGYGRIVERMATRRRALDAAQQVARVAHSDETDMDQVQSRAYQALDAAFARTQSMKWHKVSDKPAGREAMPFTPLSTNTPEIDQVMDNCIGFGTRTSVLAASMTGKTSILVQMAVDWAMMGYPIRFVSMEKSDQLLKAHMVRYLAWLQRLTVDTAEKQLETYDIAILDERVAVRDITNSLRADVANGLGILFLDTVQKLLDADSRDGVTASSLASASAAVEGFKLESGWCVVQAVQQTIETNSTDPKKLRPSRNNVKGAKAIFEDDDNMMGVYRADLWRHEYGTAYQDINCLESEVLIKALKIRDGNPFKFKSKKLRFIETIPAMVSPSMLQKPHQRTFTEASHPEEDLIEPEAAR